MGLIVAYYRVSTKRQGQSALGLDAQRAAVLEFCRSTGATLLAEFSEVESGTHSARPKLSAACRVAKARKATLVVAKLDRISRNVAFVSRLMESEVEFVVCDAPFANRLTLHILAAMAEYEAKMIGERTRVALRAVKARGKLLGSHRPGHWIGREQQRLDGMGKARKAAADVKRSECIDAYTDVAKLVAELHNSGRSSDQIADALNAAGEVTRQGNRWRATTVWRLLERIRKSPGRFIDSPLTPRG